MSFVERDFKNINMSLVERDFQNNALAFDLTYVPGIHPANERILNENNITTASQLVGYYFTCQRDKNLFIGFLTDLGINIKYAEICTRAFQRKFNHL